MNNVTTEQDYYKDLQFEWPSSKIMQLQSELNKIFADLNKERNKDKLNEEMD